MKKILAFALALMFCLSTAFAWDCPACGSANEGKFCTECGTKKPANTCPACGTDFGDSLPKFCTECGQQLAAAATEAPAAPEATQEPAETAAEPMITYATQLDSGTIGFMWDADGVQAYTVEFIPKKSDDPYADRAADNGFHVISGTDSAGVIQCSSVIPGVDYWLGLFDAQGQGHYTPFESNPTGVYTELELTPVVLPQRIVNGEQAGMSAFSLEEINAGDACGLYLCVFYENPGEDKEYMAHVIIETSTGVQYPLSGTLLLASTGDSISAAGWTGLDLTGYFAKLKECLGEVPLGEYKVTMYLDMALAFTSTFTVQELAVPVETEDPEQTADAEAVEALAIADAVIEDNGVVTVTWTGGKAPYQVTYYQKNSDDLQADYAAAEELGLFFGQEFDEAQAEIYALIPGVSYWIILQDAQGNQDYISGSIPEEAFADFSTELVMSSNPVNADKSDLAEDFENSLYIAFVHDNPGEVREMILLCVVDYGNGVKKVTEAGYWQAQNGKNCMSMGSFSSMEAMREETFAAADFAPETDLTISVYLDGKLAGRAVLPAQASAETETVESGVFITGVEENADGTATITWTDENNLGPYEVGYYQKFTDDFHADRGAGTGYWYDTLEAVGGSHTMQWLVPGQAYWLVVYDSNGMGQYIDYQPAAVQAFPEFTLGLTCQPLLNAGTEMEVSTFSSAEIGTGLSSHGLELWIEYPQLAKARDYRGVIAITAPDGSRVAENCFDLHLDQGEAGAIGWQSYSLDWYFGILIDSMGSCPVGTYTVELYCDGEYAAATTFEITE